MTILFIFLDVVLTLMPSDKSPKKSFKKFPLDDDGNNLYSKHVKSIYFYKLNN